jgi:glutaredoxin 2
LLEAEFDRKLEVAKESNYRLYLEKIKARNSEHRSREKFLLNELQQLEAVHKAKAEDTIGKYEALLAEGQSIIEQQQAVLNAYSPELKVIHASFQQQMQALMEERDRIYAQLQLYHAARRFTGSTKADIRGP